MHSHAVQNKKGDKLKHTQVQLFGDNVIRKGKVEEKGDVTGSVKDSAHAELCTAGCCILPALTRSAVNEYQIRNGLNANTLYEDVKVASFLLRWYKELALLPPCWMSSSRRHRSKDIVLLLLDVDAVD